MRIVFATLLIACSDSNPPLCGDTSSCADQAVTLVLASDYISASVSAYSSDWNKLSASPADGDSHLLRLGLRAAVLQRGGADNLLWLHPKTQLPDDQWALPAGSNPQDAMLSGAIILISLYAEPRLLRFELDGTELPAINLAAYTDADAKPEATHMYSLAQDKVLIALQNLDFRGVEPISPRHSRMVLIDPQLGTVDDEFSLPGNPFTRFVALPDGRLAIACNRSWGIDDDAGLWIFDPVLGDGEIILQERLINGNIIALEVQDQRFFLVVAKADFTTAVYHWDSASGLSPAYGGNSDQIGCITALDDGGIWVCDRSPGAPGLRQLYPDRQMISPNLVATDLAPLEILSLGPAL